MSRSSKGWISKSDRAATNQTVIVSPPHWDMLKGQTVGISLLRKHSEQELMTLESSRFLQVYPRCVLQDLMVQWVGSEVIWPYISMLKEPASIRPNKRVKGCCPARKTKLQDLFVCVGDESSRVWSAWISGPWRHAALYPAWRHTHTHRGTHIWKP